MKFQNSGLPSVRKKYKLPVQIDASKIKSLDQNASQNNIYYMSDVAPIT